MKRRLYFMFPSAAQAQAAVDELTAREGIKARHMHAMARKGVDLGELPVATALQQKALSAKLARWLWESDLALFALALVGFITVLFFGQVLWALIALLVMALTIIIGALYAMRVPESSLREFQSSLAHGEVLLMVDVPMHKVSAVEYCIGHHHHSAVAGGSSWSMDLFGI